jgi:glutathione S-transferase
MKEREVTTTETESGTRFTLWGAPLSVYSAKVRSYLIKKRIPYRELFPSHPDFQSRILPSLGFFVIPVLETPGGEIVQDTSDIIDYLEARFPEPSFVPQTPVQQTVATLLCAFGSEGLNQPSMHYRWSFLDEHGDYIVTEFGRAASQSRDLAQRKAAAEPSIALMKEHLPRLGIKAETIPAIESAYLALLDALDVLFLYHPYLLGGRPSMADFGFMAGLYAHLSRDPVPSALMKSRAPHVFRWTERMNIANLDDGEFPEAADAYLPNDELPEALEPILRLVFSDWGAELSASMAHYNAWIADQPHLPEGHLVSSTGERAVHPGLGPIQYAFRGVTMTKECWPQMLWHFHKALQAANSLRGDARDQWQALLARTGGEKVMSLKPARTMSRKNNVLVLD